MLVLAAADEAAPVVAPAAPEPAPETAMDASAAREAAMAALEAAIAAPEAAAPEAASGPAAAAPETAAPAEETAAPETAMDASAAREAAMAALEAAIAAPEAAAPEAASGPATAAPETVAPAEETVAPAPGATATWPALHEHAAQAHHEAVLLSAGWAGENAGWLKAHLASHFAEVAGRTSAPEAAVPEAPLPEAVVPRSNRPEPNKGEDPPPAAEVPCGEPICSWLAGAALDVADGIGRSATRLEAFAMGGADAVHLQRGPDSLKDDEEVVLAAVSIAPLALRMADRKYSRNRRVVLTAVGRNGASLQLAAPELRADAEVVGVAVSQFGQSLRYAEGLRADTAVVLKAVQQDGLAIQHAAVELQDVKDPVVLAAVTTTPLALVHVSDRLRADAEVVTAAVSRDGRALRFADPSLREDMEVVATAVGSHGAAIEFAALSLRQDKEVVLAAVTRDGRALRFAADELRSDPDVVAAAVCSNAAALEWVSRSLMDSAADLMFVDRELWEVSWPPPRQPSSAVSSRYLSQVSAPCDSVQPLLPQTAQTGGQAAMVSTQMGPMRALWAEAVPGVSRPRCFLEFLARGTEATTTIQRYFRGRRDRGRAAAKATARGAGRVHAAMWVHFAVVVVGGLCARQIQRHVRGYRCRLMVARKATLVIQASTRGFLARHGMTRRGHPSRAAEESADDGIGCRVGLVRRRKMERLAELEREIATAAAEVSPHVAQPAHASALGCHWPG